MVTDEQKKKIYTDAFNNEENNGGCCQCVLGSIMENCGGVSESTFQAATAMAAGVGRNGSACGGCTGAILAIGSFLGRDYENFATEKGQQLKADSSLLARKVVEKFEKECAQWKQQDEDVLSYALFPQVAKEFFEYREAQQTKVDQSIADKENGAYPV